MHGSPCFTGIGFGAIQSGLFLSEAFKTRKYDRLVVAEVNPARVDAIRRNDGIFSVNVAHKNQRTVEHVEGVEIFNPTLPSEATKLVDALAESTEIATALPSIEFYNQGTPSVASLLHEALQQKQDNPNLPSALIYSAENHNHAAEHLEQAIVQHNRTETQPIGPHMQVLNTVIGKMCSVVTDPAIIETLDLTPVVPRAEEAFLVEAFNQILITSIDLPDAKRAITVFTEQPDLLPFEEAKLYGHNAIHALLGFLAHQEGLATMAALRDHPKLMEIARHAFIDECGAALIKKHQGLDVLFTNDGFKAYAEDLLVRMTNPWLNDPVDRIIRDPLRKLSWNDRFIGAMRMTMSQGIIPIHLAQGAKAAIRMINSPGPLDRLSESWQQEGADERSMENIFKLLV